MKTGFVELGETAEFVNGVAFKPEDWVSSGKRIIRIQNLTDPSKPFNFTERSIDPKFLVEPGDILVSWSASLGVFQWQGPDTAVLNQHIFRVVPRIDKVWKPYLRHLLVDALVRMEKHLHGATMKHVNRGEFLSTPVYLPSLAEQKRIAAILDKADALRRKRQEAIAKLDTLLQSVFLDIVGDVGLSRWPLTTLDQICHRITDGTHQPPKWAAEGIPFLFVSNIVDGQIDFKTQKFISAETHSELMRRCPVEVGDVLYTTVGSYGNVALVHTERPFSFQRHIAHLKPNRSKVLPAFLTGMLASKLVRHQADRQVRGIAQQTLNLGQLKQFEVIVPPLEVQSRYVVAREEICQLKCQCSHFNSASDQFLASLQSSLFF